MLFIYFVAWAFILEILGKQHKLEPRITRKRNSLLSYFYLALCLTNTIYFKIRLPQTDEPSSMKLKKEISQVLIVMFVFNFENLVIKHIFVFEFTQ